MAKRLVVRTPDLIVRHDNLVDSSDIGEQFFCLGDLRKFFEIPADAAAIHIEGSRSRLGRESQRFLIEHSTNQSCNFVSYKRGEVWERMYDSLRPFIAELGIEPGQTGYVYVRVLYSERSHHDF